MPSRLITESVEPRLVARVHLSLLRIAATFTRHFRIKGFGRFVAFVARLFPQDDSAIFRLADNARLRVFLRDAYWIAPLLRDRTYEADVGHVFARLDWEGAAFIDCGANIGYWSVVIAAKVNHPKRVVAIEASGAIYEQLRDNARLNGDSFDTIHAAVWHRSGEMVSFAVDEERHSWASAAPHIRDALFEVGFRDDPVRSLTIDDVVAERVEGEPDLFVVKIDVEGAEVAALQGASRTLSRNTLLIYEDHGRDESSMVTKHVSMLGLSIFYTDNNGALRALTDLGDLHDLKAERSTAYNLFACATDAKIHRQMLLLTSKTTSGHR